MSLASKSDSTDDIDEDDGELKIDEDIINIKGENEDTPLHEACRVGHLEIVKTLLERGANIEDANWDRRTPLHHACAENHLNVAEYLIEQ